MLLKTEFGGSCFVVLFPFLLPENLPFSVVMAVKTKVKRLL